MPKKPNKASKTPKPKSRGRGKPKRRFPGGLPNIIPVNDINNFKVLGLDGAFLTSGWSILDQDENLLDYGTISQHEHKKSQSKLDFIVYYFSELSKIIENWKPDIMIIEDAYAHLNMLTYKKLTKMHGVSELCAKFLKVPHVYYCFATEARSVAFNLGKADKQEIFDKLQMKYGSEIFNKTLDISDSIVLSICGVKMAKSDFM